MSSEKLATEDFKVSEEYVENVGANSSGLDVPRPARAFTLEEEDRLYRKMDIRILPMLAVLYLLSFMDRGNIGNARLAGLEKDLGMDSNQYAVALSVFFISYALFEIPSNLMLTKMRPSVWITIITLSWGTVMTLMGVVQSYAGLVVTRLILGGTEAGLFPGVVLLLTFWYPRERLQRRVALFFSAATLAGAFSGLLAYGIGFMDGVAGYAGWRWIFILEGIMTVVAGVVAYFVLVDLPEQATFLTEDEKAWVIYRKAIDNGGTTEESHLSWAAFKAAFTDIKSYVAFGYYLSVLVPLYGVGLFAPSLINSFGKWTRPQVQLLTVPLYVFACIYVIVTAIYSDRLRTRYPFLLAAQILMAIGFAINLTPAPPGAKFVGLYLCAAGAYGGVPSMIAWFSGNNAGRVKRAVATGLVLGLGSLGGIASSNIYRKEGAPRYFLGHGFELGVVVLGMFCSTLYAMLCRRDNAARIKEQERQSELPERERKVYTLEELQALGDRSPNFIYTI